MSAPETLEERSAKRIRETAREFLEQQLVDLDLSVERIESQNLEELEQSLERVNDAIAHPESFTKYQMEVESGAILATKSTARIEIGMLPLLLERKKLILERIGMLKGEEQVESLRELVRGEADQDIRSEVEERLDELQAEVTKWHDEVKKTDEAQEQAQFEQQAQFTKIVAFERRWAVWQSILERESVATILGGILLFMITLFLIIATLAQVSVSQILSNAFLIILGYFFGQSVGRTSTTGS